MPERRALLVLAAAMLALAALYLVARPSAEEAPLPDDPLALARRIRTHPADWRAAGALSEHALDARVPRRVALWHAANDIAMRLAPIRQAPRMQLARAAFFHWTELSAADRRAALDTIAPLLRDPETFYRMVRPLFELTGDLALLRRWNPGNAHSLEILRNLAATNGRFAEYRELRQEVIRQRTAEFREQLHRLTAPEIIAALPQPPYSTDDEPLLRDALAELHRRPLTEDPHYTAVTDALAGYALRHRLGPLDGIAVKTEPRGTWQHLRENGWVNYASWIDREMAGPASIAIETVKSDEVPPYVEIYLDDARVAEGEVAASRNFAIPSSAGLHRLEVLVANPFTRNGASRIVRVVSVVP